MFERKYNAVSIANLKAGISLETKDFNAEMIKNIVSDFNVNKIYANNSKKAGEELLSLRGTGKAVQAIEDIIQVN